jgi:parvulin-like peptidyl-prolyl isomerase
MAKTAQRRSSAAGRRTRRKGAAPEVERKTKKQIAIGRKQARQNRIIWLSVGALGLVLLLVLGFGLMQELVMKPATPVAIVNGTKIRADDYATLLNYRRYSLHNNIRDLEAALQSVDTTQEGSDFLVSFYQQQLQQLQSALANVSESTLDEMIQDELVQEKAGALGITVTEADVQQTIDEQLQQAASPPAQTPITDTQESPTPTPVPQEQLDQIYQNALDSMGLTDREFRTIVEQGLYRTRLQEVLASQVPTTGLVVHIEMIQTVTETVATEAQQRIENGEDFAAVAEETSQDAQVQDNGGDLGWVTTGQLSDRYGQPMEDLAFSLDVGQVGMVESDGSFYVVKVLERDENGPLPQEVLTLRQNSALQDWLQQQMESPDVKIERLLTPDQIPPDPYVTPTAG